MTEQTGEHFQTSPELGFAFGRIPMQEALDFLSSPELRRDGEADDMHLYLMMAQGYFEGGPNLSPWNDYVEAQRLLAAMEVDRLYSEDVYQKYREVATLMRQEHAEFVDGEAADINALLARYPGLITQDTQDGAVLQSVASYHIELTEYAVRQGQAPVRQVARWGDAPEAEIEHPTALFVDMAALPAKYSRALRHYQVLYG